MTMPSDIIGIVGLDLQGIAVLLDGVSAYCIRRQLTALAPAGQANVSERLASQSIEILKYIADGPLAEYFWERQTALRREA